MAYKIDGSVCTGCGTCAENCPSGAIRKEGSCYSIDAGKCSLCGTCAENCPVGASCRG